MMTMMGGSKDGAFRSSGEVEVEAAFIGVGCNRVVGAVAWGPCNLVAFAAHHVVAIFSPQVFFSSSSLLSGSRLHVSSCPLLRVVCV
jgi:hypothetical protein